jgi:hypothetical protein
MGNRKNASANSTADAPSRGPGRPSAFPADIQATLVNRPFRVPQETLSQLEFLLARPNLKSQYGTDPRTGKAFPVSIGSFIARLVDTAYRNANRTRSATSKKGSRTTTPDENQG